MPLICASQTHQLCSYMEQRQAQLQAQQQGWLQERRQAVGSMPERTQELLQIEVRFFCIPWRSISLVGNVPMGLHSTAQLFPLVCTTCNLPADRPAFQPCPVPCAIPVSVAAKRLQVGEVCHASVLDARPGGRQAWRPAVATIT